MDIRHPGKTDIYSLFGIPETVNVANKPLRLGGISKEVPTMEFARQQNMTDWCEGLVADNNDIHDFPKHLGYFTIPKSSIISDIKEYQKKIVICYMGDEAGYGACALEEIPENTYVALYSGQIIPVNDKHPFKDHSNPYAASLDYILSGKPGASINAEKIGNISRFFQHAPENLDDYNVTNIDLNTIATANLEIAKFSYQGNPFICFKTKRKMQMGEPFLWDYRRVYWEGMELQPRLFDLDGRIINPTSYILKMKNIMIDFESNHKSYHIGLTSPIDITQLTKEDFPLSIENEEYKVGISYEQFQQALKDQRNAYELNFSDPVFIYHITKEHSTKQKQPAHEENDINKRSTFNFNNMFIDKPTLINQQLRRISNVLLPALNWSYDEKKKTAVLNGVETDRVAIKILAEHLKKYKDQFNLVIAHGNNPTTKLPTIYVQKLEKIDQLENIDVASLPINKLFL